jgi:GT2 family glycosyltransferase
MDYTKVSIVILNWNGLEDTTECLASMKNITYPNYEVVVVDNCSDGDDVARLKQRFGEYIQLVVNEKNYGAPEGYNSGIRHVFANSRPKPQYMVCMNNDIVVDPEFLTEMVKAATEDESIGIVGPKIYYYSCNNRNDVIWSAGGKILPWHPHIHHHTGENDNDYPKYQHKTTVDWITGALFMLKFSLIEDIGLMNTRYFIGLEDTEYCLKARKRGYKIVYVPSAKVWHKVGSSIHKSERSYTDLSAYYFFLRENFSTPVYIYHLLLLPLLILYWGILYLARRRDKRSLRVFVGNLKRLLKIK